MGEWTAAEREFRSALQSAEERNDERYTRLIAHNLGTPAGMRGDFGEAVALVEPHAAHATVRHRQCRRKLWPT